MFSFSDKCKPEETEQFKIYRTIRFDAISTLILLFLRAHHWSDRAPTPRCAISLARNRGHWAAPSLDCHHPTAHRFQIAFLSFIKFFLGNIQCCLSFCDGERIGLNFRSLRHCLFLFGPFRACTKLPLEFSVNIFQLSKSVLIREQFCEIWFYRVVWEELIECGSIAMRGSTDRCKGILDE
jgi:hypothetical protein